MDHTRWYTIDYNKLEELTAPNFEPGMDSQNELQPAQVKPVITSACTLEGTNLNQAIPESLVLQELKLRVPILFII